MWPGPQLVVNVEMEVKVVFVVHVVVIATGVYPPHLFLMFTFENLDRSGSRVDRRVS